jgi:membrane-associated phospholipid phosphatase
VADEGAGQSYRQWLLLARGGAEPASRRDRILSWLPTVLLGATLATIELAVDPPSDPRWTRRNSFDDSIRRGLLASSREGRDAANTASHAILGGLGALLVGDWVWLRDEYSLVPSVKKDAEWLMGSLIVQRATKLAAARERPYVLPCSGNSQYVSNCLEFSDHNTSFFSGHAATGATFAGLVCSRHLHRPERSYRDALVCGGAAGLSLAAGILRITADQHFTSDVIVGWATGALFGYILPSRFTYGRWRFGPVTVHSFAPSFSREFAGLRFALRF